MMPETAPTRAELRERVQNVLLAQGFRIEDGKLPPPPLRDKDAVRRLHGMAAQYRRQEAMSALRRWERKNWLLWAGGL